MWHKLKSFIKTLLKTKSPNCLPLIRNSMIIDVIVYFHRISKKKMSSESGNFPESGLYITFLSVIHFTERKISSKNSYTKNFGLVNAELFGDGTHGEKEELGLQWDGKIPRTMTRTYDLVIISLKSIPTCYLFFFWSLLECACLFLFFSTTKLLPLGLHLLEKWGTKA